MLERNLPSTREEMRRFHRLPRRCGWRRLQFRRQRNILSPGQVSLRQRPGLLGDEPQVRPPVRLRRRLGWSRLQSVFRFYDTNFCFLVQKTLRSSFFSFFKLCGFPPWFPNCLSNRKMLQWNKHIFLLLLLGLCRFPGVSQRPVPVRQWTLLSEPMALWWFLRLPR